MIAGFSAYTMIAHRVGHDRQLLVILKINTRSSKRSDHPNIVIFKIKVKIVILKIKITLLLLLKERLWS